MPAEHTKAATRPQGLIVACSIITIWAVSLATLLHTDMSRLSLPWTILAMLWQMFLYTGLFITAHDAMHGVVCPDSPRTNYFIGSFTLLIYGLFLYAPLKEAHWQHHQYPASDRDPDFHDGHWTNFFAWYFHFMKRYWSWPRFLALVALYHLIHQLVHIPESNLTLFWVLPSFFSSFQLFYFGTFLPHRKPIGGYQEPFRTQSVYRPVFWSFLTCYHFGYHREHHEFPHVPWWQLPEKAKQRSQV